MRSTRLAGPILAVTFASVLASAAPLRDFPVTARQPDGTSVALLATGDEFHRRVHDAEGFTVVRDPVSGWIVYADRVGADLVPTGLAAGISDPRAAGLQAGLDEDLERVAQRVQPMRVARQAWMSAPTQGKVTNLMIFVRFEGDDELTERIDDYEREFNAEGPGSTSLRAYYQETSRGAIDVTTIYVPPPDDQGWAVAYTDPHPRTYYSAYADWNKGGYQDDHEAEQREHALLADALRAIEAQIPDDAVLDADADGIVDNVIFMIQGVPDQWSNLLWPHQWEMFDDVPLRNAKVSGYNVQFTSLMLLSTGTFAHEMAHTLGAPDLYHYNQDNLTPVGPWDLMEATSSPPQHMLAYMKWKYFGWVEALPTVAHGAEVRLFPSWDKGTQAVRVEAGGDPQQWFALEYRRAEGPFESSLPGSGLLAYRIDERFTGWGNRSGPPDEVYVFRPGGAPDKRGSVGRAPMGTGTGRDRMNETSDPAPTLQEGEPVTLRVYDVVEDSEGVTFKVCLVAPDCAGKTCGDDGCGSLCGVCAGLTHCVDGGCVPCSCDGKVCGDNGCGTSCGSCEDDNACTVDSCADGQDVCVHAAAQQGTACDDGDPCTSGDGCDGEWTCAGVAFTCQPETCRSVTCDGTGGCLKELLATGTACDDGDPCTSDDRCDEAGLCAGTPSCQPEVDPAADAVSVDAAGDASGDAPGDAPGDADLLPDAGKPRGKGGCAAGTGARAAGSNATSPAGAFLLLLLGGAFLGLRRARRT